jgi:hypothetical protein
MATRASTTRHDLPAQLYRQRAADIEANSRILRDFMLRVNLDDNADQEGGSDSGPAN